jgi:beta-lactamase regulating signal transducer with metallopeptidase domain
MTAIVVEAALRSLVFAVAVGIGLRLLRVSNVPVRKAAWSVVLIAALAMPWLMRLPASKFDARFGFSLPLPLEHAVAQPLPARSSPHVILASAPADDVVPANTRVEEAPTVISAAPDEAPATSTMNPVAARKQFQWPPATTMIAWIYLSISGLLLLRLLWGLAMAIRLWATAERVSPLVAPEPNVRSSRKIPSPVTIGSGIVLPGDYLEWDRKKLRMVLAHERSHVRQLDFYLQVLAGLYTALFWFSPLGWWLRRTLTTLGEAIGDRAGLDAAASRSGYAALLLEFAAMPRQALPGVAMARKGNLSHRIERMLNERLFHSAFAEGRRRAFVSLLLIPAALFGATALIRVARAQNAQNPPAAPVAPTAPIAARVPAPPTDLLTVAPIDIGIPPEAPPPLAGVVPTPPAHLPDDQDAPQAAPPSPPAPPALGEGTATGTLANGDSVTVRGSATSRPLLAEDQTVSGYGYHFSADGDSYAIVDGPSDEFTFSGDWGGGRKADLEAARKVTKGPFLWFSHGGKSYIVTDPQIIARIREMYQPMDELGREQEELGKQQEDLGRQQEELGREQEGVQVKMPDMSKELAELDAVLAKANQEREQLNTKQLAEAEASLKAAQDKMLTPEKMADLQEKLADAQAAWNDHMAQMEAQLAELQGKLGALQGEAGARQSEFGAKMGMLGDQQGYLGAEQGRLGEQQGKLAQEADRKVRGIIDECLHNGKATQVPNVK